MSTAKKLTVVMVLTCSLSAGVAPPAYAVHDEREPHRVRPAKPLVPPGTPPGLKERQDHDTPERPPQAETPRTGPIKEEPL